MKETGMNSSRIRTSVRRMRGYVPGEQPRDPRVIKLNTNENPYPPSPAVAEALRMLEVSQLRLYPDPVSRALRQRLAEIHRVTPEQVFIGNGSDEVLALCVRAFVDRPGRTVSFFDPSYSLYPVIAEAEEVPVEPIALGPEFEWRRPDCSRADLFFMTHPNAPTGLVYPEAEIAAFCDAFPGVVVVDEAYVDFARSDLMPLARSRPNVIVARTLSKSFSLAGLRVGYAVGPEPLISAMFTLKDSYNIDRVAQQLALAAVNDLDYMRATAARIVATRRRVGEALAQRGCRVTPSDTNFIWFRPLEGQTAQETVAALRAQRILVRHFPGPRTGEYIRVTIGTDSEMDAFLAAL